MGVTRNEDVKCMTTIAQKPQGENGNLLLYGSYTIYEVIIYNLKIIIS